jgi:hypothetical protein
MQNISQFAALPIWLAAPILVLFALGAAWPSLFETLQSLSSNYREYTRKKRNLEILKLRYEIEVLRKTNGLTVFSDQVDDQARSNSDRPKESDSVRHVNIQNINIWWRLALGAIGGIAPAMVNLLGHITATRDIALPGLAYLIGLSIYGVLGAIIVAIFGSREDRNPLYYVFLGLVGPALMQVFANAAISFPEGTHVPNS